MRKDLKNYFATYSRLCLLSQLFACFFLQIILGFYYQLHFERPFSWGELIFMNLLLFFYPSYLSISTWLYIIIFSLPLVNLTSWSIYISARILSFIIQSFIIISIFLIVFFTFPNLKINILYFIYWLILSFLLYNILIFMFNKFFK